MAYFDQQDLEARVSSAKLVDALDDDNDGIVDGAAMARLIEDACSYVDSFLYGVYPMPIVGVAPPLLKRLSLDVAEAQIHIRHPELNGRDGAKMLAAVRGELRELKVASTRLDSNTVTPRNVGGIVYSSGPRMTIDSDDGTSNSGDF